MSEETKPSALGSGVANPSTIDLVAEDPLTRSWLLVMIEMRPWDGSPVRFRELQTKVNTYLAFALDGEMAVKYPDAVDMPVRIELHCATQPDGSTAAFLRRLREKVLENGLDFVVRLYPDMRIFGL